MLVDLGESLKGFEKLYRCKEEKNQELMEQVQGWTMRCQVLEERLEQGERKQQEEVQRMKEEHAGELARVRREFKIELESLRRAAQQKQPAPKIEPRPTSTQRKEPEEILETHSGGSNEVSLMAVENSENGGQIGASSINDNTEPEPVPQRLKLEASDACNDAGDETTITISAPPPRRQDARLPCERTSRGNEGFSCYVCNKQFLSKGDFQQHLRTHPEKQKYKCATCNKILNTKNSFRVHLEIHNPNRERKFACPSCSKACLTSQHLATHMVTHRAEKPFKCSQCPQGFKLPDGLKKHLVIHSERRPFPCELCGKNFKRTDQLIMHMRLHTGERPYSCHICKKRFTQLSHVEPHVRTHHVDKGLEAVDERGQLKTEQAAQWNSDTEPTNDSSGGGAGITDGSRRACGVATVESMGKNLDPLVLSSHGELGPVSREFSNQRPDHRMGHRSENSVKCPQCSQLFKWPSKLYLHLVVHSELKPFQCELCKKRFKRSFELVQHGRIHTGERPYSCKICQRTYTNSGTLSNHMQTHPGEGGKIHECNICKRTFTRKSSLREHQRRLHKSELVPHDKTGGK